MTTTSDRAALEAETLYGLARYDQALAVVGRALAADPQHKTLLFIGVRCHLALGQHAEALSLAERTAALYPEDHRSVLLLSRAQSAVQQPDAAYASARRLPQVAPDDPWSYVQVALTASALGHHDEAIANARHVLRLAPDQAHGHLVMIEALLAVPTTSIRAAAGRTDEARRHADAAIALAPQDPKVMSAYSRVLNRQGQYTAGLGSGAAAVRTDPVRGTGADGVSYALFGQLANLELMVLLAWPVVFLLGLVAGDQGRRWVTLVAMSVIAALALRQVVRLRRASGGQLGTYLRAFLPREPFALACGLAVLASWALMVAAALGPVGRWAELMWSVTASVALGLILHKRAVDRFRGRLS